MAHHRAAVVTCKGKGDAHARRRVPVRVPQPLFRETLPRSTRFVLALGCISTHRPVAGGASWHTVRAFSNDAVVVEKDRGRRAKKGECEGTGQVLRRSPETSAVLSTCEGRGELRAREEFPGYRADADSVEVVLAGCRESDWTAEVVTSRSPQMNCIRRAMSIIRRWNEPLSAVEPTNRTRRDSVKWRPPRTSTSASSPRSTISSYTLARVVTTIVSGAAHEPRSIDMAVVFRSWRCAILSAAVRLSRRFSGTTHQRRSGTRDRSRRG